jgi:hypothetical protein
MAEPLVVVTRSGVRELLLEAVNEALRQAPAQDEVLMAEEVAK